MSRYMVGVQIKKQANIAIKVTSICVRHMCFTVGASSRICAILAHHCSCERACVFCFLSGSGTALLGVASFCVQAKAQAL